MAVGSPDKPCVGNPFGILAHRPDPTLILDVLSFAFVMNRKATQSHRRLKASVSWFDDNFFCNFNDSGVAIGCAVHAVGAQTNLVWGKREPFGIFAYGPAPTLLCHWTDTLRSPKHSTKDPTCHWPCRQHLLHTSTTASKRCSAGTDFRRTLPHCRHRPPKQPCPQPSPRVCVATPTGPSTEAAAGDVNCMCDKISSKVAADATLRA